MDTAEIAPSNSVASRASDLHTLGRDYIDSDGIDIEDHYNSDSDLPPPYTPFQASEPALLGNDDIELGNDCSGTYRDMVSDVWQFTPIPSTPTALETFRARGRLQAQQFLSPTSGIRVTTSGEFRSVNVQVVPDTGARHRGLVRIEVRAQDIAWKPCEGSCSLQPFPAEVISVVDTKSGDNLIYIISKSDGTDELAKKAPSVDVVCTLTLPMDGATPLSRVMLKLPDRSKLSVRDIPDGPLEYFDVAAISATVSIAGVSANGLRVALGDGEAEMDRVKCARMEVASLGGVVRITDSLVADRLKTNVPGARLELENVKARHAVMLVLTKSFPLVMRNVSAKSIDLMSGLESIIMDGVRCESIGIECAGSLIRGDWSVSRSLDIIAQSSIIQGAVEILGENARVFIRNKNLPVKLALKNKYRGWFDIGARSSVVNCGGAFESPTLFVNTAERREGVVGVGSANMLVVENENSPIELTSQQQ